MKNDESDRERAVVEMWVGARLVGGRLEWDDRVPQEEIARRLDTTVARVRQIVGRFREYLRDQLGEDR